MTWRCIVFWGVSVGLTNLPADTPLEFVLKVNLHLHLNVKSQIIAKKTLQLNPQNKDTPNLRFLEISNQRLLKSVALNGKGSNLRITIKTVEPQRYLFLGLSGWHWPSALNTLFVDQTTRYFCFNFWWTSTSCFARTMN